MLLLLPLGLYLPEGVTVEFTGGARRQLAFQQCDQSGCVCEYAISQPEIDGLVAGKGATVSAQTLDRHTLSVQVPLSGFAIAYEKIR